MGSWIKHSEQEKNKWWDLYINHHVAIKDIATRFSITKSLLESYLLERRNKEQVKRPASDWVRPEELYGKELATVPWHSCPFKGENIK